MTKTASAKKKTTKKRQSTKKTSAKVSPKNTVKTAKKQNFIASTVVVWLIFVVCALFVGLSFSAILKDPTTKKNYDKDQLGNYVTLIGDSISYQSEKEIKEALPGVDFEAVSGIQFVGYREPYGEGGFERLKKHAMREVVVFMLGSNNGLDTNQLNDLYDYVGPKRKLVLMTNYVGRRLDDSIEWNSIIMRFAQKYDNIHLLDWYIVNVNDPTIYLKEDKLHPNEDGRKEFARLIRQNVLQALDLEN